MINYLQYYYGGTTDKSNVICITLLSELLIKSRLVNLNQNLTIVIIYYKFPIWW